MKVTVPIKRVADRPEVALSVNAGALDAFLALYAAKQLISPENSLRTLGLTPAFDAFTVAELRQALDESEKAENATAVKSVGLVDLSIVQEEEATPGPVEVASSSATLTSFKRR